MKSTENGKDIWMGVLDYKEVKLTDERLKKGVDTIMNTFKKECCCIFAESTMTNTLKNRNYEKH